MGRVSGCPVDDVLLSPRTSIWTVRPTLDELVAGTSGLGEDGMLVAPIADDEGPARAALLGLGLDAEDVLTTHEPATRAGSVTTVPLPPDTYAVRRVLARRRR